jgi:hypothetical protein
MLKVMSIAISRTTRTNAVRLRALNFRFVERAHLIKAMKLMSELMPSKGR